MRKRKPWTDAYFWANLEREKREACAAGNHKFSGWKQDESQRSYWDCLHECGYHRYATSLASTRDEDVAKWAGEWVEYAHKKFPDALVTSQEFRNEVRGTTQILIHVDPKRVGDA
ncbi:hypothetical protein [Acrocarpospora sp. B8E8]|uniref:hypothetical protein n=1 Tax=Acrocarpospora sp. B8E8 TaxID=3153572 RepID=UPI00325DD7CE